MFLLKASSSALDWFRALVVQNGFMRELKKKATSDRENDSLDGRRRELDLLLTKVYLW